ncbi:hypothetical protein V3C99_007339 [Haemonchus contortus]
MARGHLLSSDEKAHHEVWRAVRRCENITRQAMEKVPRITDRHKEARLGFAKMNLGRDWAKCMKIELRNPGNEAPKLLSTGTASLHLRVGGEISYNIDEECNQLAKHIQI